MLTTDMPFHSGERAAQSRAGAGDVARRVAPFIRDHMPEQHRAFYQDQPFLVVASADAQGRVWTTLIEGEDGFVQSPDPRRLELVTQVDPSDPLAEALQREVDLGVLGIELASRRRNRLSGRTQPTKNGFAIDIRQTFGNCPQYISERDSWRVLHTDRSPHVTSDHLSAAQIAGISTADTLFIGSGHHGEAGAASNGFDASHRGGAAGFVRMISPTRLRIPDYSGNNFFNTIGNLLEDARIGLLFVDFSTGGLLHLTGRATIDWTPEEAQDPGVLRVIEVEIEEVIDRRAALSLRWSKTPSPSRPLKVIDKVVEAQDITSFHLAAVDDTALAPFEAGQHLPILFNIPGQTAKLRRTYTLSGKSGDPFYRITVKREPNGVVSRHLHDAVAVGDILHAKQPAGEFTLPEGDGPLVLVSAGVGLTPMLAILHETVRRGVPREIWFVHGTRNSDHHALRAEVDALISAGFAAHKKIYYSQPGSSDQIGQDFDVNGHITADHLRTLTARGDTQYMLCGPAGFVTELTSALEASGVPAAQILFETFGTAE